MRSRSKKLSRYLERGKHLPECLNDFEKQGDFFKSMSHLYQDSEAAKHSRWPSAFMGHMYVIDWFLWFMASRGYKLQKIRAKDLEFEEWPNYREILKQELERSKGDKL